MEKSKGTHGDGSRASQDEKKPRTETKRKTEPKSKTNSIKSLQSVKMKIKAFKIVLFKNKKVRFHMNKLKMKKVLRY